MTFTSLFEGCAPCLWIAFAFRCCSSFQLFVEIRDQVSLLFDGCGSGSITRRPSGSIGHTLPASIRFDPFAILPRPGSHIPMTLTRQAGRQAVEVNPLTKAELKWYSTSTIYVGLEDSRSSFSFGSRSDSIIIFRLKRRSNDDWFWQSV